MCNFKILVAVLKDKMKEVELIAKYLTKSITF